MGASRAGRWVGVAVMMAALGAPAVAAADEPEIERNPDIRGDAQVGQRLEAVGAEWEVDDDDDGPVGVGYGWLRCDNGALWTCREIPGASGTTYTVSPDDAGRRLRVVLVVVADGERAIGISRFTSPVRPAPAGSPAPTAPVPAPAPVVLPAPPPPTSPSPSPTPTPGSPGNPAPAPGTGEPGTGTPPGGGTQGGQRPARLLKPFPTVRLQGYLSQRGVVLRRFSIRTPKGVKIRLRCLGDDCPRRTWKRTTDERGTVRVRPFEGALRAGTRIKVRVTRGNRIGKHTIIRIRRDAAPARIDRCLFPGSRTPTRCPAT